MVPIDDYYLWCDHRAKSEAAEITDMAHQEKLRSDRVVRRRLFHRSGDSQSCCIGCGTTPTKRARFASAFEHCDMVAATLCGVTVPAKAKRSVCAMGHKWLWHPELGGLPSEEFLVKVDPLLAGVRAKLQGDVRDLGQYGRDALAVLGGKAGTARGHSDSRWARLMRIGTPSARARMRKMWSTWSAHPPASSEFRGNRSSSLASAGW